MKYVSDKVRKPFCADLKTIYQAPTEEKALEAMERVTEKWSEKYPNSMRSWKQNWDTISPIFKFFAAVRKVIYTTYTEKITMPIFQEVPVNKGILGKISA